MNTTRSTTQNAIWDSTLNRYVSDGVDAAYLQKCHNDVFIFQFRKMNSSFPSITCLESYDGMPILFSFLVALVIDVAVKVMDKGIAFGRYFTEVT